MDKNTEPALTSQDDTDAKLAADFEGKVRLKYGRKSQAHRDLLRLIDKYRVSGDRKA